MTQAASRGTWVSMKPLLVGGLLALCWTIVAVVSFFWAQRRFEDFILKAFPGAQMQPSFAQVMLLLAAAEAILFGAVGVVLGRTSSISRRAAALSLAVPVALVAFSAVAVATGSGSGGERVIGDVWFWLFRLTNSERAAATVLAGLPPVATYAAVRAFTSPLQPSNKRFEPTP